MNDRHADAIADLPLHLLCRKIRDGELTATELVRIYLERIRRFDGPAGINAYITVAGDAALRHAAALDKLAAAGKFAGPLHGMPLALKDNIDTRSIRTTGGARILAGWTPPADAHVVRRLTQAGAVILGKTGMHELALGITSNNPHYGPVRNPYDPTKIPGGSSGGSGAATAAALCAGAIGTDTGGSVRIPAALCGIVGLRPSLGRVGRSGVIALSFSRDTIGPMTRCVMDAAMILEAIAGHDPLDPESADRPVPMYSAGLKTDLKGIRLGVPRRFVEAMIHPDTLSVFEASLTLLAELGAGLAQVEIDHLDRCATADGDVVIPEALQQLEVYLRRCDPRMSLASCYADLGPDLQCILGGQIEGQGAGAIPAVRYLRALREDSANISAGLAQALNGVDALVLPTTPGPAIAIGQDHTVELAGIQAAVFETFIRNCVPVSIAGYPAVSVPAGYGRSGLPIGLQLVARPWEEARLLGIAHAFEQAGRIRKRPGLSTPVTQS